MCGIAGILKLDPREAAGETRLTRMRDVLVHRGPDEAGLLVAGPVGFAHRRLSIIDIAGGRQPMINADASIWITYNGEVYNFGRLRAELESRGCRFATRSDTEVVLRAYEIYGDACVERLRGMFAFAIWDSRRRRLFLARDRLGIKPLYYALTNDELLFASEIKAILAAGPIRPAFNRAVLPEFLAMGFNAGSDTFFRGIRKLPPGCTLSWSREQGLCERRYWQPPIALDDSHMPLKRRALQVRAHLEEAVRVHLVSDVPLGLFLSGGIDSTALATLMASATRGPIQTFAVGFNDRASSELDYARLAAEAIDAKHREVVVTPAQFFDALPRLIWHEDEPIAFPSSVPLYFVSRLAREHVKVVMTGEGADELFLGYNRYRVTAWNERLGRAYHALAPAALRGAVRRSIGRLPRTGRRYLDRTFLALAPDVRTLFYDNFAVYSRALQEELLADCALLRAHDPYAAALRCYYDAPAGTLERMGHADLQTYLVELLMKQDQMSMAASIESRVPFLDHELVEHVAAIPGRYKVRGWHTKVVLREAVRDLVPRAILDRPKAGFPTPLGRWLRGPYAPLLEEFVAGPRARARGWFDPVLVQRLVHEHRGGARNHADRLWLLINFEIWQRIFLEGEPAERVLRPAARGAERAVA